MSKFHCIGSIGCSRLLSTADGLLICAGSLPFPAFLESGLVLGDTLSSIGLGREIAVSRAGVGLHSQLSGLPNAQAWKFKFIMWQKL